MQHDVFISYAHNDNIAPQDEKGWVDCFHAALYQYLSGKLGLGRAAKIWRDKTGLKGNALLKEALADGVDNSVIFIPILSPNFIASEYCLGELETFCKQDDVFENLETRIFPVVKLPIDAAPTPLNDSLLKFAFFNRDDFGEMSEEIDPSLGPEFRNKFNQKVNDMAREIANFIRSNLPDAKKTPVPVDLKSTNGNKPAGGDDGDSGGTVETDEPVTRIYLAEPSPDLFEKYLEIKRDLEERREHGLLKFEFLPEPLPEGPGQFPDKPDEATDYQQIIKADVDKSRLAIHLIGKKHNGAPFGSNQSFLDLAMDVAAERDGDLNFNRLVWIPKNLFSEEEMLEKGNERHKAFISRIRQTGVSGDGLMQDSFEKFKARIIELLENKKQETMEEDDTRWVYVLYDKSDMESARGVEDKIQERGYPIYSSRDYLDPNLTGGAEMDIIKEHNDYLASCDAVLIYWDNSPLTWVRKNVSDLPRIKPRRKERPFRAQAVFCEGNIQAKSSFRSPPPPNLIKVEGYSNLSKFLDKLV